VTVHGALPADRRFGLARSPHDSCRSVESVPRCMPLRLARRPEFDRLPCRRALPRRLFCVGLVSCVSARIFFELIFDLFQCG